MRRRSGAIAPVLPALLVLAALVSLWAVIPSRLLAVCGVVGGAGALYFLVTLSVVEDRHDGRLVAVIAAFSLSYLFAVPAGVALLAHHWGVRSILQLVLLVALTFVFLYYGLFVPLAIRDYLFGADDPRASEPYPAVSVILPAYNEEAVIERSVAAITEAVYPAEKLEVIVVDDGSTDGTRRKLRRFEAANGIRVVHKENGGKYSALNYGMLYADGDVIVTVDADSVIERTALLKLVGALQANPDAGAVAGNVKVSNPDGLLGRIQSLEYVVGINVFRRAFDVFGTVSVVPGALGAYRRDVLERTGLYDPDTVTEDFDTTVKVLKQGMAVRASSARTYTQVPGTWTDLYRQRLRWYRGNFATLLKHRDVFATTRFGVLNRFAFPLLLLSMVFVPLAGFAVIAAVVVGVLAGQASELTAVVAIFVALQTFLSSLALRMEDENPWLALYAPFFVVGYRQFCDFVMLRGVADVLLGREIEWTRSDRIAETAERAG